jgi:hypothetical protein
VVDGSVVNDQQILNLNSLGFVPGPTETEREFEERSIYGLNLSENWPQVIPTEEVILTTGQVSEKAISKAKQLFDISPKWVPVFFSNYKLMPWHGGSAWIFQENENLPTSAFFQLNAHFRNNPKFLGLYERDELLAHEMSHVGRMMFEEPKFEELLAYRTSNSRFRRYFGPIVQSSHESVCFLMFMCFIFFLDFYTLTMADDESFLSIQWLKIIPMILVILAIYRLWINQSTFKAALSNLKKLTSHSDAVVYRLKDNEIELFAKSTQDEIRAYIHTQKSLRWRLIIEAYFTSINH